jgi:uncharacterized repeat protein (TIGR01451 family)
MMNNKRIWLATAVAAVSFFLVSGTVTEVRAGNQISDLMLKKFQQEVVGKLDEQGYGRLAKVLGNMDTGKWEQYARQIQQGNTDAVIAQLLQEQKEAILTDLYDKGKDYLKTLAAQREILGGNTMQYLDLLEKHGSDLLAISQEALNGNFRAAGEILFTRVKDEVRSRVEAEVREYSLELLKNSLNYIVGDAIGMNVGGIYLNIIKLELMALQVFEEYSKSYLEKFQQRLSSGWTLERSLCEQYMIHRRLGKDSRQAYYDHGSWTTIPVSIAELLESVPGMWYGHSYGDHETVRMDLERCYVQHEMNQAQIEQEARIARGVADDAVIGGLKEGMDGGKREIKEIFQTEFKTEFDLIVTIIDAKSGNRLPNAVVTVDGEKKDAPSGLAQFRRDVGVLNPSGWSSGLGRGGIEVVAEAKDYKSRTVSYTADDLGGRYDAGANQVVISIALEKEGPDDFEVAVTVKDSKTGDVIPVATVTFDGSTQTSSNGIATFTRPSTMLAPDNSGTQVDLSAEAADYPEKTRQLTAGELAQKLDKNNNRVSLEIVLEPKEESTEFELVVTVVDLNTGDNVNDATVTADGTSQSASAGVARFRQNADVLDPGNSQTQIQVAAEAPGYKSSTTPFTWGFLANRFNKAVGELPIQINLKPEEGGKIAKFEVVCDRPEIFEDENSICAARVHYESGAVKDVSIISLWTPEFVDDLKGTVRGDVVAKAHTLPHTVAVEARYTASPAEGSGLWTDDCTVMVKQRSAKPRPQIAVAKTAQPASVTIGGTITFVMTITNPGNCELANVAVTDTKCNPVAYVRGDANGDYYLDPGETWTYECSRVMDQEGDFVNTATVTGADPEGNLVTAAASVSVKVTAGLAVVPDIYDLTEEAARYDIYQAKLTVGSVGSEKSDLAAGHVTRQSPQAGEKVPVGTKVDFSISQAEAKYISVDPPRITIEQGDTIWFIATLMNDDGTEQDITQKATWTPGPRNTFVGREAGTFTVTVEHGGIKAYATVDVNEATERGWSDPMSHADDTLANAPLPGPGEYTWYALCTKGNGEVVYGENTDPTRFFIMGGPFPGPRTAEKWINDNCPRWRCTLEGACAEGPAGGGEWNVFCDPATGAITIGSGRPGAGQQVMQGGFLGEPDARYWVDQNCPAWRCTAGGGCADEPARGGNWNAYCNKETGAVTIGQGPAPFGQVIMEGGFLGEPDVRRWLDTNCPRWQCTEDGGCAIGPATGGDWYVFCSDYGDIQLGSGNPGNKRDRIMADNFLAEADARLWVDLNCPSWRCNSENGCLLTGAPGDPYESDAEIDDAIDELTPESSLDGCPTAQAEFSAAAAELDGLAVRFDETASFFEQQMRAFDPAEQSTHQSICSDPDIAYALSSARYAADEYDAYLGSLAGLYGDILADCPAAEVLSRADEEYNRLNDQGAGLHSRYADMLAEFGVYKCDEQAAITDAGDEADGGRDPEDVGAGVEVCDDGIDNDGDGAIDECDAGCCDKSVQVTVSDCGPAADDIFLVAIDGQDLGVTPKGQANTFNIDLRPGPHSATVTCLDDGGDPLGSDIGTACIWIVIYGGEAIGGDELSIAWGGSQTVGFEVPIQDDVPPFPVNIDGSSLQKLEGQGP